MNFCKRVLIIFTSNWVNYCCNATFAYDGINSTLWQAADASTATPVSLGINMTVVVQVTSIMFMVQSCPFNYSLSIGNNVWTQVYSTNNSTTSNFTISITPMDAQYGRMDIMNGCGTQVKVWEIAHYGSELISFNFNSSYVVIK